MTFHEIPTLIATFIAIGITLVGVIWTGILTRRSNDMTKTSNELTEKNLFLLQRPWLVIGNPILSMIWGSKETWNEKAYAELTLDKWNENHPFEKITWQIPVQNNGNTPIQNIKIKKIMQWEQEITIDMVKQAPVSDAPSTMLPKQSTTYPITVNLKNVPNSKSKNFWVGYMFLYEYKGHDGKITSHHVGEIWVFREDTWEGHYTWIDD